MVTPQQLRAARSFLGWDRSEVVELAKISIGTLKNIELGHTQPHASTLEILEKLYRGNGIEFIGERGVAHVNETYKLIEGTDCYLRLLDEVFHALRSKPGEEVLSICTDDEKSPPEVTQAIQRWHDAGIKCRFLSSEKSRRFDFPLNEYRLIPPRYFRNSVMMVFADKVATLRGVNGAVLVITDADQAEMLRGLFEMIWAESSRPKKAKP
jgi:transcriptional regulator with XRE-family HTH domain